MHLLLLLHLAAFFWLVFQPLISKQTSFLIGAWHPSGHDYWSLLSTNCCLSNTDHEISKTWGRMSSPAIFSSAPFLFPRRQELPEFRTPRPRRDAASASKVLAPVSASSRWRYWPHASAPAAPVRDRQSGKWQRLGRAGPGSAATGALEWLQRERR